MVSKKTYPIYVIAGKDRYQCLEALNQLKQELPGASDDLAWTRYEGKTVQIGSVLDDLWTLPFLSSQRFIVVDDADPFVSENRDLLEKYFDKPSTTGVLILVCETWRSNTRLAKRLAKIGKLISAEPPKGKALVGWLVQQARLHDKSMSPACAQALIQRVGTDTGRLTAEVEKLALYTAGKKRIDSDDLETLCGPSAEQSIFRINDLMAEGRTGEAVQTLSDLLERDRSAEYSMVGVLAFALRRLLKARAMSDAGANRRDILSACGVRPFIADRFLAQVDRFSTRKLQHMLCNLTEVDYASKTGLGNVRLNLERFIVCAADD